MTTSAFAGHVVVVAGHDPRLATVAERLLRFGAYVAFVATDRKVEAAHASFRADPTDPEVWDRVVPHVEQRLGPVDGVVCDATAAAPAQAAFGPDLARRGHGGIVTLTQDVDVDRLISVLGGML